MKPGRVRSCALLFALVVPFLPAQGVSAGSGVSSDASISYFVALNADIEDTDDRSASDFTSFNDNLRKVLSNSAASARANVRQRASVDVSPADTLDGAFASASMDVGGSSSDDPDFVTVADAEASFDVSFSVGDGVQYSVSPALSASNNDSDDCSSAEVTLDGPTSFYRETHAGGDCGGFDPASGSTSGVLASGSYQLSVVAEAAVAGEDASASGSAGYGVTIFLSPPCELTGDSGDNTLTGTAADEVICGFGGNDTINGGGGNDVITGGDGNDIIQGGAGLDEIFGETGNDEMHGGTGTDLILGAEGDDEIFGDDGSESSIANPPNAGLLGGPGDDSLTGGRGADDLLGEDGNDVLKGSAGNDELIGANGADDLFGGPDTDELMGGAARDTLVGEGGNDELFGGPVNDKLRGGNGNDRLNGEAGDDELLGQSGSDTLIGDTGEDDLTGGGGRDDMRGGDGPDFFDAKDGVKDELVGGPARDRARKDRIDDASGIEVFI